MRLRYARIATWTPVLTLAALLCACPEPAWEDASPPGDDDEALDDAVPGEGDDPEMEVDAEGLGDSGPLDDDDPAPPDDPAGDDDDPVGDDEPEGEVPDDDDPEGEVPDDDDEPAEDDEPEGEVPDDDDESIDTEPVFPFEPWSLNVFVQGDIGSQAEPYESDFEGGAAAGGDVWFTSFSLNWVGPVALPKSLHAGGDVGVTGAIDNGGIEAGGDVWISWASVDGDVVAGGDLTGTSGAIAGDVVLAGSKLVGPVSISGSLTEGQPYAPSADLGAMGAMFVQTSATAAALPPTTAASDHWGELVIELVSGVNVVEIDADELLDAWGVTFDGPADAWAVVNVAGEAAALDGMVWAYAGDMESTRVLLNYFEATSLLITGGDHHVNILAPFAATEFPSGLVTGKLVVASLVGGGQVNWACWTPLP